MQKGTQWVDDSIVELFLTIVIVFIIVLYVGGCGKRQKEKGADTRFI